MRLFNQYKGLNKEVYVLFACKLIDAMGSMVGPMFTLILSLKLGLNATEIALYTTIFMFISMPVNIIGGKICDKYNKKTIINICDIATSIIYILCGIFGISKLTIVIYCIGSLLQTAEGPTYDSLVADFTIGEQRDKAYSLLYLGTNLGMMLAPTIGGLLINNHIELMFILNGVFQLLSIITFDMFVKETTAIVDDTNKYESKSDSVSTLQILKENAVVTYFMIIFAISLFIYNMWGYLMPLSLTHVQGEAGSIYYGTMSTLNCVEVVLFTSIVTSLTSRFTSINRMILGDGLEVLGFIIFVLFIKHPFAYYISIFVFTLGEIVNTITTSPHLTKRIPINYRGRILALENVFSSIVIAIGEIVIGIVYDKYGLNTSWLIIILIGFAAILAYQLCKKKDKETFPELYK